MSEKLPDDFWTGPVSEDPLARIVECGAELKDIEAHEEEVESLVQQMWKDLTTESRLLEGTEIEAREEIVIPREPEEEVWKRIRSENELSPTESNEATNGECTRSVASRESPLYSSQHSSPSVPTGLQNA